MKLFFAMAATWWTAYLRPCHAVAQEANNVLFPDARLQVVMLGRTKDLMGASFLIPPRVKG